MNKATIFILFIAVIAAIAWSTVPFLPGGGAQAPAGAPPGGVASVQSQLPPTQVIVYAPAAPASSTPVERGSCWTNSIAAPFRTDAWRCTVGNSISDPCFEIPGSKDLLCGADPAEPDATSAFVLRLTAPLPAAEPAQGPVPTDWAWLVMLGDGTVCSPFTGTLPITATHEAASYGCAPKTPGAEAPLIFGDFTANAEGGGNGNTLFATVGTLAASTSGLPAIVSPRQVPVATIWQ